MIPLGDYDLPIDPPDTVIRGCERCGQPFLARRVRIPGQTFTTVCGCCRDGQPRPKDAPDPLTWEFNPEYGGWQPAA